MFFDGNQLTLFQTFKFIFQRNNVLVLFVRNYTKINNTIKMDIIHRQILNDHLYINDCYQTFYFVFILLIDFKPFTIEGNCYHINDIIFLNLLKLFSQNIILVISFLGIYHLYFNISFVIMILNNIDYGSTFESEINDCNDSSF